MADLTTLEAKLGEVTGLAMAAQDPTKKVTTLVKKEKEHGSSSARSSAWARRRRRPRSGARRSRPG